MNEEAREIRKEIAATRLQLRNNEISENEKRRLVEKENLLKQDLYRARIEEVFGRMERRIDDKHKRR
jgi:hypothetical protein